MPDSVHTSFKDLVSVVRRSPAMLIALGFIAVVIAYIVYKRSQSGTSNTTAATSGSTDMTAQPGYFLMYNESNPPTININDQDSTTHPAPLPTPTPPADVTGGFKANPWVALYQGKPPKGVTTNTHSVITVAGNRWMIGGGGNGRIWGVPYTPGLTRAQWEKTPIAVGQKQLLWQT
jgi:hypothetical protein